MKILKTSIAVAICSILISMPASAQQKPKLSDPEIASVGYRKRQKAASRKEVVAGTFLHEKTIPMFSGNSNNDTEKNFGNRELNSVIENAIQRIPVDYRLIFTLREMNGMSVNETAKVLEITETNVKVRLNRAKGLLRKEVEKMYSPEEIYSFNLVYCDKIVAKVMERINKL